MNSGAALPSYEPMLAAYHRAFATELRAMIGALPIAQGQTILDMACGDGVYGGWLAERVGSSGRVVAADVRPDYLKMARIHVSKPALEWIAAAIEALPFADSSFDLCWCAQSLYSLPDPAEALRHMLRVTKPGGIVAILEDDTLHNVLLPWPVDVELAVRAAELNAVTDQSRQPRKFYVGRWLRPLLRDAGLERIETRTFATDRGARLGPDETIFLTEYIRRLSETVTPYLDARIRPRFDRLVDPGSDGFLLNDPDLTATCIDHVVWGRKPHSCS